MVYHCSIMELIKEKNIFLGVSSRYYLLQTNNTFANISAFQIQSYFKPGFYWFIISVTKPQCARSHSNGLLAEDV